MMSPPQGYVASSVIPQELWYDVRDYGADPSGVADSTTAIQAAINAAVVTGGIVYIPSGNYLISSALSIISPMVIRGEGGMVASGLFRGSRIFTNTIGIHLIDVALTVGGGNEAGGGEISDLLLDGNHKATIGLNISGAFSTKMLFSKLEIVYCTHLGLYIAANHSFAFYSCTFAVNGPLAGAAATDGGAQVDGANAVFFYACNFEANHGSGVIFSAGYSNGVRGGVVETNDFHGISCPKGNNPQHILIDDVTLESNNQSSSANIYDIFLDSPAAGASYCTVIGVKCSGTLVTNSIFNGGTRNAIIHPRSISTPKISFTATTGVYVGQMSDLTSANLPAGVSRLFIDSGGTGAPAIFGIDNRSGLVAADGSPITLYAVPAGAGQLFRITADIFATVVSAGTANYTITWTENAQSKTMAVAASVVNTLGTVTDLINPDASTNITAQLTFAGFTGTVKVASVVEQLA